MIPRYFLFIFLCLLTLHSISQTKFEKEYRLKEDQVPAKAINFVEPQKLDTKVKWYYEENFEGNSIEAKFKYDGRRYSVEFDTSGVLQDIEIEALPIERPGNLNKLILEQWDLNFKKYKYVKLQFQYSGAIKSFDDFLRSEDPEQDYTMKYELVLKVRTEEGWKMYELLYDQDDTLERKSRIVFRNTDNLEF